MNTLSKFDFSVVNQRTLMLGLAALWVTMQFWLFYTGGIRPAGDTGRYIGAAEVLLSGHFPTSGKAMAYLAYDGIIETLILMCSSCSVNI